MEERHETSPDSTSAVPLSPRPTAFTIDFDDKKVDLQRHKSLAEKFQQRHKRGKSMSKLEGSSGSSVGVGNEKKHPLTGNLPRKSSFQSEGYFSSDERPERCKSANVATTKRSDLTLPLEGVASERMTHSFPNATLLSLDSPSMACDLLNVSSPEFELISPFSPNLEDVTRSVGELNLSPEKLQFDSTLTDKDFDDKKSDTVSEAGTYTVDNDNYTEEQKARMSIDNDFKIEKISVEDKTMEYIKSLSSQNFLAEDTTSSSVFSSQISGSSSTVSSLQSSFSANGTIGSAKPHHQLNNELHNLIQGKKPLSPILSPTQNLSLITNEKKRQSPVHTPRVKSAPSNIEKQKSDQGSIISVTSSGVFRSKNEEQRKLERRLSLTKSEVHVEAYVDGKIYNEDMLNNSSARPGSNRKSKLTANIVNVQSIEVNSGSGADVGSVVSASFSLGRSGNVATVTTGLPLTPTGKTSPTKIPSPIHTISRPRSRNNLSAMPDDFDTDTILRPTRNYINSLQQKLSQDNSDQDSDYEQKYGLQLNNTAHLLKQRALHIRHNSLDDKTINNKLEHFQNKNLQPIDQTYTNVFGQYPRQKVVNKINNSPSNSPIRRSSSFSNRNQINNVVKSNNLGLLKDSNLCPSPKLQKSSSTACIKPGLGASRVEEHRKIDRNKFGDTETSSEEDLEANMQKRKDLGSLSNTRCNRTFSLRRARVDNEAGKLKCPNTPDMRRKTFQPVGVKQERAISVDRKPIKTNEVQSRYLLSLNKRASSVAKEVPKTVTNRNSCPVTKPPSTFNRSEGGRFSMRTSKSTNTTSKSGKKDGKGSKQNNGPRSNSSLSSREMEFQNWKRRKSYDPMKAAAEGKKKELEKRLSGITGPHNKTGMASPESSPSHSGSVHRSQSFHGTAALEQLISSDEEDLTFSADECFSPPTPSPCELSPTKASLRHSLWDRIRN
ncbi:uncharacterized protein [Euwallacea fornicatus]|uniref:uncharacterized protein isoform X1 n=1 Tax=Euwallacea fornicatus TaxID=995702 RepID=UPI00338E43EA